MPFLLFFLIVSIMLNQIKLFFNEHIKLPAPEEPSAEKLQIASAALLLEMVTIDDKNRGGRTTSD